jgi:hypothetical protein
MLNRESQRRMPSRLPGVSEPSVLTPPWVWAELCSSPAEEGELRAIILNVGLKGNAGSPRCEARELHKACR